MDHTASIEVIPHQSEPASPNQLSTHNENPSPGHAPSSLHSEPQRPSHQTPSHLSSNPLFEERDLPVKKHAVNMKSK